MTTLPPIKATRRYIGTGVRVVPSYKKRFSYHWLTRKKRSHPWSESAYCFVAGDVCQRTAELYFEAFGIMSDDYALAKLVDGQTWHRMQVTQHLRAIGMKP